jgi:hypothetical protein
MKSLRTRAKPEEPAITALGNDRFAEAGPGNAPNPIAAGSSAHFEQWITALLDNVFTIGDAHP